MLWLLILVMAIIVAAAILLKAQFKRVPAKYPYQKADSIFSPAERSFLGVLERAVGDEYRVFGKIRLADVIRPQKGSSSSDRQKSFNKIVSKHVDFALCKKDDLSLVCAIELDDASHERNDRKDRDQFLEGALNAASIPFVRFTARASYSIQDVGGEIGKATSLNLKSPATRPAPQAGKRDEGKREEPKRVCPKCASPMVLRKAASGKYAGKRFWGCSRYPECRTLFPVKEDPISHA
jgi:hypothetical protein